MDANEFRDQCAHTEWADAQTWRAVRGLEAGQRDERLLWLFHHVHLVQRIYFQAWRGDPFELTDLSSFADLAALERWSRPYHEQLAAFAATLGDRRLADTVTLQPQWAAMIAERFAAPPAVTLGETAWQVFLHTSYHRGQISTRLRELGGEPPLVDYIYWVWSGRPAPSW